MDFAALVDATKRSLVLIEQFVPEPRARAAVSRECHESDACRHCVLVCVVHRIELVAIEQEFCVGEISVAGCRRSGTESIQTRAFGQLVSTELDVNRLQQSALQIAVQRIHCTHKCTEHYYFHIVSLTIYFFVN